jgi:ElaB/YqjD/DUF883 family membrane-anchored ribosome-binding protein
MDEAKQPSSQDFARETSGVSNPGTDSATATRMKEQVANKASEVRDVATDIHRRAADKLEDVRQTAASQLDRTASNLHSGADQVASSVHSKTDRFASKVHNRADQVSSLGHSAADGVQSIADYIRNAKLNSIGKDLEGVVKEYPIQSLAVATFAGFLLARGLGRRN